MRLSGASYEEVARAGGGIVSTVAAMRAAGPEALLAEALARVDPMIAEGVSVSVIKSGYGLDLDTELKVLRVARQIAAQRPIEVKTTFLGAHAVPAAHAGRADGYIDDVCIPALRAAHAEGLVDAVDGFCEGIAFDTAQIARVFEVARALGLPVKLHAEQLSNIGGAQLAARYGTLSADHVEYASDDDTRALDLPPFLTPDPGLNSGLNSGLMLAEVTTAALMSENKHPANPCTTNITPASANQEDHVSMAAHAARRLVAMNANLTVIRGVAAICGAQGIAYRAPLQSSRPLLNVIAQLRTKVPALAQDRYLAPCLEAAADMVATGALCDAVDLPGFVKGMKE